MSRFLPGADMIVGPNSSVVNTYVVVCVGSPPPLVSSVTFINRDTQAYDLIR